MSLKIKIATVDIETWGFKHGRKPEPFAVEWCASETEYKQFWGPRCIIEYIDFITSYPEPCITYAHNGGKFDFMFMLAGIDGRKIRIINRRIVKCFIGKQEHRDSWVIMPEKLESFPSRYGKKKIDYALFEPELIELHKPQILDYLHFDCLTLLENVVTFLEEFQVEGRLPLTIGQAAMRELRLRHKIETWNGKRPTDFDARFRQYYYGGRTQCFAAGVIHGNYKIYDVNGMYQKVMRDMLHPVTVSCTRSYKITDKTDFATIRANNLGALPMRTKEGISFDVEQGIFFATIHEIRAGLELGILEILEVLETYEFHRRDSFDRFIDHFTDRKLDAERRGDKMHRANYKRVMNASYGKFATNAAEYMDYCITYNELLDAPWQEAERHGLWFIWERPSPRKRWYNVATAASITGGARALLMRGLARAVNPVYCDTDSIICTALDADIDATKLGAWKLEGEGDEVAMAGKKLYAVFDEGEKIKQACKGVKFSADEIRQIAQGKKLTFANPVPSFRLAGGAPRFITRHVEATAKAGRIPKLLPPHR